MPPPRPCWPALSLMGLREVGYPPHQAGLASWEDWRCSCLCSELIPSVAERSALFVKELSSHRRRQLMMPFSTRTGLERVGIAGPELELSLGRSAGSGSWTPLQKQERKRVGGGLPVAAPMPKSVLSCGEKRSTV